MLSDGQVVKLTRCDVCQAGEVKGKSPAVTPEAVGARLRQALKEAGLTQRAVAAAAPGVDEPRVSRLVTGDRGMLAEPLYLTLAAVCRMGVSLDFVIAGIGHPLRLRADMTPEAIQTILELADQIRGRPAAEVDGTPRKLSGRQAPRAQRRRKASSDTT